jgi:hypothetical protein
MPSRLLALLPALALVPFAAAISTPPVGTVCSSDLLVPEVVDIAHRLPAGGNPATGGTVWFFIPVAPAGLLEGAAVPGLDSARTDSADTSDTSSAVGNPTDVWGLMNTLCAVSGDILSCFDDAVGLDAVNANAAAAPAGQTALCQVVDRVQDVAACLAANPNGWSRCTASDAAAEAASAALALQQLSVYG